MAPYTLLKLAEEVKDKKRAIQFLQNKNIIHKIKKCKNNNDMVLNLSNKSDRWICKKKNCRYEEGIRKNTWLEGSRIDFFVLFIISVCIVYKVSKVELSDN